jgi:hypothetical protein
MLGKRLAKTKSADENHSPKTCEKYVVNLDFGSITARNFSTALKS